jgi:hypothetical protein
VVAAAREVVKIIGVGDAEKLAETPCGLFMATFCGFDGPLTAPANPENWQPVLAVPSTATTLPASYHPEEGLIDPPELALVAR